MRIKISNGHIICPSSQINATGDLYIAEGKILSVLRPLDGFTADVELDVPGQYVCPGIVDLSTHLREPGYAHKATIASECKAAACSGITSMVCHPDTQPVIDTPAVVELIHQRQSDARRTNIYPMGALTRGLTGEQLTEVLALKEAGCVGLSQARLPIIDTEVLRRALEYASGFALPVFICPEDHYLKNNGVMHEGRISTRLGLPGIPETAETVALSRVLLLVEQTGASVHFSRLSTAKSVEMIGLARQRGLPVTADVGICHLYLTEADVDGFNAQCHLLPPLRSDRDKQALIDGLATGVIDAVCSDHQPHDEDAKAAPFSATEPGASTLEVLAPLMFSLTDDNRLTIETMLRALTQRPASIINRPVGTLSENANADLFIFDKRLNWTVNAEKWVSAGKNTPFDGWEMHGKVTHTILNGELVYPFQ